MAVLEYHDVDPITTQAREWPFGRTMLSVAATVLIGLGRLAYVLCAGLWLVLTWCAAAVKVGWEDARQARQDRADEANRRVSDGVGA